MNCRKYRKFFSAYLDGELSMKQRHYFEGHLAECRQCSSEFDEFKKVIALTANLPRVQPSPDFDRSLQARLVNNEPVAEFSFLFNRRVVAFIGTACLLLVMVLGIYVYIGIQSEDRHTLVGREVIPTVSSTSDDQALEKSQAFEKGLSERVLGTPSLEDFASRNVLFVMPSVPITEINGSFLSYAETEDRHRSRDFVLPSIMGKYLSEDEADFVLKEVNLMNDSEEPGLWH